jgi:hypothetical protein
MSIGSITSPYFAQATPWPYIKGPNYTRPVFGENTRNGAFMAQPMVRMPSLRGLGVIEVPASCWEVSGFKACHDLALADAQKIAAPMFDAGTDNYNKIVAAMLDANLATRCMKMCSAPTSPTLPGQGPSDPSVVPSSAWYSNPLYLGGAIIGGAVVLGLITRYIRSQQGY